MNWHDASQLARNGLHVRRETWEPGRWLIYQRGIAWHWNGENWRIVESKDFGADEWNADDWTNIPAELAHCPIVEIEETEILITPSPPLKPLVPPDPPEPDDTHDPGDPPTIGGLIGLAGGFGGGGGGTKPPRPKPKPYIQWPSLSLTMDDWTEPHPCYPYDGVKFKTAKYGGSVTLGTTPDTAPGGPASGLYSVRVQYADRFLWVGIMSPGDSRDYGIHETTKGQPGKSKFTFTARVGSIRPRGCPDITAKQSATQQPWCIVCSTGTKPSGENVFEITERQFWQLWKGGTWNISASQSGGQTTGQGSEEHSSGSGSLSVYKNGCLHQMYGEYVMSIHYKEANGYEFDQATTNSFFISIAITTYATINETKYYMSISGYNNTLSTGAAGDTGYPKGSITVYGKRLAVHGIWLPGWAGASEYTNTHVATMTANFTPDT